LLKFKRVEVVWYGIVGGIFEVFGNVSGNQRGENNMFLGKYLVNKTNIPAREYSETLASALAMIEIIKLKLYERRLID
jgi:hypothetical protein